MWEGTVTKGNEVYLTFDDGPNETATPFVLQQLEQYNMKASFFCIGKNVVRHPEIYNQIIAKGHAVGNHTMHHINGKLTDAPAYLANIQAAAKHIDAHFFRPPYGQITKRQAALIRRTHPALQIVMWSVLTGDFDTKLSGEQCFEKSVPHIKPGAIIVLHDSEKAMPRLAKALPLLLGWLQAHGFQSCALS